MTFLHIFVLALVQGITEFLPISSSGHLILVPLLTEWPDQGMTMDVAVHIGTLLAVLIYFWSDVWFMLRGTGRLIKGKQDPGATLTGRVIIGTIPVIVVGYLMSRYMDMDALRTLKVIGWTTLGYGLLLWIVDRMSMTVKRIEHMGVIDALIIGLLQCLALVPGTSRSGITMTAARLLGFERSESARFSMLLSMPTIAAAGTLVLKDLMEAGDLRLTEQAGMAAGLSFVSALVAIWLMMGWLKHSGFMPFVIYRILLGSFLLALAYGGPSILPF
ncbi:MAG: undecaprenyl-diphosphate phosphatase [Rhodospirillum sp.]|nr:undecaprenyl-diphosphate phosphatase [Rhodospirillum sp.]MCF8489128.1 undecaprenyl-diphosphate phosphatase [Rhodospirillum sp.]MCF8498918.1 undecaprenyl-diphosphate phosphatase [Rhodospirillum sp.]